MDDTSRKESTLLEELVAKRKAEFKKKQRKTMKSAHASTPKPGERVTKWTFGMRHEMYPSMFPPPATRMAQEGLKAGLGHPVHHRQLELIDYISPLFSIQKSTSHNEQFNYKRLLFSQFNSNELFIRLFLGNNIFEMMVSRSDWFPVVTALDSKTAWRPTTVSFLSYWLAFTTLPQHFNNVSVNGLSSFVIHIQKLVGTYQL